MSYPKTGEEVYVSLNLSNTMLTGIGKGTITREEVSADYLKRLFARYGVIVSAKPEQRRLWSWSMIILIWGWRSPRR